MNAAGSGQRRLLRLGWPFGTLLKGDLVFPADDGTLSIHQDHVDRPLKGALKLAGLRNIRFHDLRHAFASQHVSAGRSIKEVQELLGHETIQMTMRYAHLAPERMRDAVEALETPVQAGPRREVGNIVATNEKSPVDCSAGLLYKDLFPRASFQNCSGGRIRTCGLRVMSPTSYLAAPPRIKVCVQYAPRRGTSTLSWDDLAVFLRPTRGGAQTSKLVAAKVAPLARPQVV